MGSFRKSHWLIGTSDMDLRVNKTSQIDEVYLSHLQPVHSGGLALNGKAVFPTATIYVNKVEADFWLKPTSTSYQWVLVTYQRMK